MVVDFEVASDFHCTRRADKSSPQIFLGASLHALKDSDCICSTLKVDTIVRNKFSYPEITNSELVIKILLTIGILI